MELLPFLTLEYFIKKNWKGSEIHLFLGQKIVCNIYIYIYI